MHQISGRVLSLLYLDSSVGFICIVASPRFHFDKSTLSWLAFESIVTRLTWAFMLLACTQQMKWNENKKRKTHEIQMKKKLG